MEISINKTTGSYPLKHNQHQSFKGYDARPLKAIVMTICDEKNKSFEIIRQMSEIGTKEGFRVYFTNQTNKLYANLELIKKFFKLGTFGFSKWAQDNAVLTPDNRVLTKLYGENNWDYDNPGVFELNLPKSSKEIAFYDYRTKDKTKTFPLQILESGNEYEFYDKDGSVRKGMGGVMYDDIFMQSRDGKKVMVYQYKKNGEHAGAFEELGSIEPGYLDKEQYGNNLLINDILSSHGTDYHYINVEATVKDLDEIVQMAKYSD